MAFGGVVCSSSETELCERPGNRQVGQVRDEKLDPADVYAKGGSVAETPAIYASLGEVGRSNPWITLNALRALKG